MTARAWRAAAIAATTAIVAAAAPARAQELDEIDPDTTSFERGPELPLVLCYLPVIPSRGCPLVVYGEASAALERVTGDGPDQDLGRLGVELGILPSADAFGRMHFGPSFEIAAEGWDGLAGGRLQSWLLVPKIRARIWVREGWIAFDGGVGAALALRRRAIEPDPGRELRRAGLQVDLGVTGHGVAGLFIAASQLFDPQQVSGPELHWIFGVRASLGATAAVLPIALTSALAVSGAGD
jgi:hypothetical protein